MIKKQWSLNITKRYAQNNDQNDILASKIPRNIIEKKQVFHQNKLRKIQEIKTWLILSCMAARNKNSFGYVRGAPACSAICVAHKKIIFFMPNKALVL